MKITNTQIVDGTAFTTQFVATRDHQATDRQAPEGTHNDQTRYYIDGLAVSREHYRNDFARAIVNELTPDQATPRTAEKDR